MAPDGSVPPGLSGTEPPRVPPLLLREARVPFIGKSGRRSDPSRHSRAKRMFEYMSSQSSAILPHDRFFPALTAMRGLAAWWVVFYHFRGEVPKALFGETLYSVISHGDLAVDFFFELSGFV